VVARSEGLWQPADAEAVAGAEGFPAAPFDESPEQDYEPPPL